MDAAAASDAARGIMTMPDEPPPPRRGDDRRRRRVPSVGIVVVAAAVVAMMMATATEAAAFANVIRRQSSTPTSSSSSSSPPASAVAGRGVRRRRGASFPSRSIPGDDRGDDGDGEDDDGRRRRGGVGDGRGRRGLFRKSGENTFGNVGRVVVGARDDDDYGARGDHREDDVDEASYRLARDLAARRGIDLLGADGDGRGRRGGREPRQQPRRPTSTPSRGGGSTGAWRANRRGIDDDDDNVDEGGGAYGDVRRRQRLFRVPVPPAAGRGGAGIRNFGGANDVDAGGTRDDGNNDAYGARPPKQRPASPMPPIPYPPTPQQWQQMRQQWKQRPIPVTRPTTATTIATRSRSSPLSELASWGDARGGGGIDVPPPTLQQQRSSGYAPSTTGWRQQWPRPQQAQPPYQQQAAPPYSYQQWQQRPMPPAPPAYSYYRQDQQRPPTNDRSSPSSYPYSSSTFSVPLSLLAIQPHIKPLDRSGGNFGGGVGSISGFGGGGGGGAPSYGSTSFSSPSSSSPALPFAKLDSSEFRQPYQQGLGGGMAAASAAQSSWQSQQREQLQYSPQTSQASQQQQQQWRQQQQQRQSSSFQPLPFQSQPQSAFRQPYQGRNNNYDHGGGGDYCESTWFDGNGLPPSGFFNGPPPGPAGYGQSSRPPPSLGNEYDGMILASPFEVPPMMMMFPQSPNGMMPPPRQQQSRSTSGGEEGIKVPKDPFVERQKKKIQAHQSPFSSPSSPSSPSSSSSSSSTSRGSRSSGGQDGVKIPKEPSIKVPKDPFAERRKEQNGRPQQLQTKEQSIKAGTNGDTKVPTDPFLERSRQAKRPNYEMNHNSKFSRQQSTVDDQQIMSPSSGSNGDRSNDDIKCPREPFMTKGDQKQQPQSPPSTLSERQSKFKPRGITTTTAREKKGGDNNGSSRSFGGNLSFGSQSGEDMSFEEYSSYFDVP